MYCTSCRAARSPGAETCPNCGAVLVPGDAAHGEPPAVPSIAIATMGQRLGALAVDLGISAAASLALVFAVSASLAAQLDGLRDRSYLFGIVAVSAVAIGLGYGLWLWHRLATVGQSIGKSVGGIRILDEVTLQPVGWWRILARQLVLVLTGAVVVGYFSPLFDSRRRNQGWHDKVAHTVVIDVRRGPDPIRAVLRTAASQSAPATAPRAWTPVAVGDEIFGPVVPIHATASTALPAPSIPRARRSPAPPSPGAAPALLPTRRIARMPAAEISPLSTDRSAQLPGPVAPPPAMSPVTPPSPLGPAPATGSPAAVATTGAAPAGVGSENRVNSALISAVPGMTPSATANEGPPSQATVESESAAGHTHAAAPLRRGQPLVLRFDTGEVHPVVGFGLIGRDPEPMMGENVDALIALADPGMSMSKTHLAFGRDDRGTWLDDRHSTNGTRVLRLDGEVLSLVPGRRIYVTATDTVELGFRRVRVAEG